ncbi:MAG: hypothetical protein JXR60_11110 [Bacteroidales bacterium]|nr:hypothetical protein [Bacteroidales bacterium]
MKNILLLFLIACYTVSYSQSSVKINPNVGLTISKMTEDNANQAHLSYVAGFDVRIGNIVNIIPGLYFGNIGTQIDYEDQTHE